MGASFSNEIDYKILYDQFKAIKPDPNITYWISMSKELSDIRILGVIGKGVENLKIEIADTDDPFESNNKYRTVIIPDDIKYTMPGPRCNLVVLPSSINAYQDMLRNGVINSSYGDNSLNSLRDLRSDFKLARYVFIRESVFMQIRGVYAVDKSFLNESVLDQYISTIPSLKKYTDEIKISQELARFKNSNPAVSKLVNFINKNNLNEQKKFYENTEPEEKTYTQFTNLFLTLENKKRVEEFVDDYKLKRKAEKTRIMANDLKIVKLEEDSFKKLTDSGKLTENIIQDEKMFEYYLDVCSFKINSLYSYYTTKNIALFEKQHGEYIKEDQINYGNYVINSQKTFHEYNIISDEVLTKDIYKRDDGLSERIEVIDKSLRYTNTVNCLIGRNIGRYTPVNYAYGLENIKKFKSHITAVFNYILTEEDKNNNNNNAVQEIYQFDKEESDLREIQNNLNLLRYVALKLDQQNRNELSQYISTVITASEELFKKLSNQYNNEIPGYIYIAFMNNIYKILYTVMLVIVTEYYTKDQARNVLIFADKVRIVLYLAYVTKSFTTNLFESCILNDLNQLRADYVPDETHNVFQLNDGIMFYKHKLHFPSKRNFYLREIAKSSVSILPTVLTLLVSAPAPPVLTKMSSAIAPPVLKRLPSAAPPPKPFVISNDDIGLGIQADEEDEKKVEDEPLFKSMVMMNHQLKAYASDNNDFNAIIVTPGDSGSTTGRENINILGNVKYINLTNTFTVDGGQLLNDVKSAQFIFANSLEDYLKLVTSDTKSAKKNFYLVEIDRFYNSEFEIILLNNNSATDDQDKLRGDQEINVIDKPYSLYKTKYISVTIVVVEDGSTDEIKIAIDSYWPDTTIYTSLNLNVIHNLKSIDIKGSSEISLGNNAIFVTRSIKNIGPLILKCIESQRFDNKTFVKLENKNINETHMQPQLSQTWKGSPVSGTLYTKENSSDGSVNHILLVGEFHDNQDRNKNYVRTLENAYHVYKKSRKIKFIAEKALFDAGDDKNMIGTKVMNRPYLEIDLEVPDANIRTFSQISHNLTFDQVLGHSTGKSVDEVVDICVYYTQSVLKYLLIDDVKDFDDYKTYVSRGEDHKKIYSIIVAELKILKDRANSVPINKRKEIYDKVIQYQKTMPIHKTGNSTSASNYLTEYSACLFDVPVVINIYYFTSTNHDILLICGDRHRINILMLDLLSSNDYKGIPNVSQGMGINIAEYCESALNNQNYKTKYNIKQLTKFDSPPEFIKDLKSNNQCVDNIDSEFCHVSGGTYSSEIMLILAIAFIVVMLILLFYKLITEKNKQMHNNHNITHFNTVYLE